MEVAVFMWMFIKGIMLYLTKEVWIATIWCFDLGSEGGNMKDPSTKHKLADRSGRLWWESMSWPERDGFLNPAEQLPGLSNQPSCFTSNQRRPAANTGNNVWGHDTHANTEPINELGLSEFHSCFIPSFQMWNDAPGRQTHSQWPNRGPWNPFLKSHSV